MEQEINEHEPMEILQKKHKKEKKELQSKIQSLKKSATKGDKKKKKEVQEEIAKLELELTERQEQEVKQLLSTTPKEDDVCETIASIDISDEKPGMKVTKAQKRRDKKAAQQKERDRRILEQELENKTGQRNIEAEKINEELRKRGLMIYDIEADGNCMYNAVDHQLKMKNNVTYGVKRLRQETCNHIKENAADYLPFLSNPNTGDMMTDKDFEEYCFNIANTTNWGGQVELRALSHVIKKPVTVIQADGPPLIMGEEYMNNSESLIVSYHRHMYKLGEHYNSVQPYVDDS
ncbi:hypothetical protein RUM44_007898 [Polyplax serrata]|uniref:OTU domain-containing protein n=1 Tax=Polyplax serrata TaxID=468196 RepID=A0ABR1BAU1_POLSC